MPNQPVMGLEGVQDFRKAHQTLALLAAIMMLGACGGGGGGGGSNVRVDPPPAAPPPAPVVSAPSPAYSQHLVATNAAPAAQAGMTGSGVVIGILDSGVNRTHPALSPRVVANLTYVSASSNDLTRDDVDGHGTAVSQAMAGMPFGAWPGGIAPGARIVSARIISDKPPVDDGSGQGNEVTGALGFRPIHQALIDRGAKVMNNSWGGLYWTNLQATAPIADEYRPFVISNGGLVVFATGNSSFANPSSMAALPSQAGQNGTFPGADLERGWIAVTALDRDDPTQIASYANRCGVAMRYCMAAPGSVVVTGTNDGPTAPTYFRWTGTSLAAPLVSGAAALVWQAFPYFNNDLVRQTLLGTANDLGAPGVDPVFGYGGLNIGNAIKGPARFDWGTVTVAVPAGTSTWSNTITGAGGLVKQGTGTLVLAGATQYSGATRVAAGTLETAGSLGGSAQIDSGTTLRLRGGANGNLANAGTLAMAGSAGARAIEGDYTQSSSARLLFLVGAPLSVRGTAALAGELQVTGIASGYVRNASNRETVLTTNAGLTGTWSSLTGGTGVFLDASLGYDATQAWLDIRRLDVTAAAQSMGVSPMALSSAERVEGAFDAIDDGALTGGDSFLAGAGVLQRSASALEAERTLSSLSGELQAADGLYATMAIEGGRRALESRIDVHRARLDTGAWATTDGFQRQATGRLTVDGQGWTLGQDFKFGTGRLGNALTVGAAFGQTRAQAWLGDGNDRDRVRLVDAQAYAVWHAGNNYLLARVAQGNIERRVQRDLWLGGSSFRALSDHDSDYSAVELQAGRQFGFGDLRLTPYAGVQAMQLDRDGFSEDDATGFGLTADGSRMRATQGVMGLRFGRDWRFGSAGLALVGRAEWVRTLSQSGVDIDARFNAIDVWSPIPGQGFARDARIYGFGLEALFPRAGTWRLGLDQRLEDGRGWSQASLDWRFGF